MFWAATNELNIHKQSVCICLTLVFPASALMFVFFFHPIPSLTIFPLKCFHMGNGQIRTNTKNNKWFAARSNRIINKSYRMRMFCLLFIMCLIPEPNIRFYDSFASLLKSLRRISSPVFKFSWISVLSENGFPILKRVCANF